MPLQIVHYPHPTLRHKSSPVARIDAEFRKLVAEMLELMYEYKGVGLAANQVDLPLRFFVCNPAGSMDDGEEFVFINPVISRPTGSAEAEEGCLSLPGLYHTVRRPKTIHFQAYSLSGEEINLELDDFFGRVVQHETDHLDGVMFFDRLSEPDLADLESGIEEFEIEFASLQAIGQIPSNEQIQQRLADLEQRYAKASGN